MKVACAASGLHHSCTLQHVLEPSSNEKHYRRHTYRCTCTCTAHSSCCAQGMTEFGVINQSLERLEIEFGACTVHSSCCAQGKIEFGVINQSVSAFNHILTDVSLVVYQVCHVVVYQVPGVPCRCVPGVPCRPGNVCDCHV